MSLWIALRFPQLPLEALSPASETPCVVFERGGKRRQVLCANAPAQSTGISPGMALGTSRQRAFARPVGRHYCAALFRGPISEPHGTCGL